MRNYSIAVIPGDGIGKDVIDVGVAAMRQAQEVCGDFEIEFETFPCGAVRTTSNTAR
jgi:isocitrate/isopropylmalate dehydrogenase